MGRNTHSAVGSGEPALIFIHGGLACRGFWDGELRRFAASHRVTAPDLVGHGESGANRSKWGPPEFGADIRAIVEAERLSEIIIFGNSLGGPVAIEAAMLLDRVAGVLELRGKSCAEGVEAGDILVKVDAFTVTGDPTWARS